MEWFFRKIPVEQLNITLKLVGVDLFQRSAQFFQQGTFVLVREWNFLALCERICASADYNTIGIRVHDVGGGQELNQFGGQN